MKAEIVKHRLNFYCRWWDEMTEGEKQSKDGQWVRERIEQFNYAMQEMERSKPIEQFRKILQS